MRPSSLLVTTALASALAASLVAQTVPEVKLPPSPMGQAAVQLGGRWEKTADGERYRDGKWLVVAYGRPLLRGRTDIFGSGADYGKRVIPDSTIWRMGANDTTHAHDAGGAANGRQHAPTRRLQPVRRSQGRATGRWSLNTQPRQPKYDPNEKVLLYGSYNYDAKFDVMRAPMTVRTTDTSVEQLTIGFVNVTTTTATMTVSWDKTVASVDVKLATTGTK